MRQLPTAIESRGHGFSGPRNAPVFLNWQLLFIGFSSAVLGCVFFNTPLNAQQTTLSRPPLVEPRPGTPIPPPRVARMIKREDFELEVLPDENLKTGSNLIRPIADELRRKVTGESSNLSSKKSLFRVPSDSKGQNTESGQLKPISFTDLPQLEIPESSSNEAKTGNQFPYVDQEKTTKYAGPKPISVQPELQEDIAPGVDLNVVPKPQAQSTIPLSPPPVEQFQVEQLQSPQTKSLQSQSPQIQVEQIQSEPYRDGDQQNQSQYQQGEPIQGQPRDYQPRDNQPRDNQPIQGRQIDAEHSQVEQIEVEQNADIYRDGKLDSKTTFPLWWDELVVNSQSKAPNHWDVGINDLILYFLKNSPRLRAIQLVRESSQPAIPENMAEFDPTVFVESNFVRLNDPIGNTLTTGGTGRFLDNNWTSRGGLRKKFKTGGSLEAFQRFGVQTNNSEFFDPDQQGTAYLSLNFTQPLLNGRGRLYNESLIAIASLENNLAGSVAEEKIQTELLELTQQYWELYSLRAIWFQKRKNVERAESVYNELLGRKDFDVSRTQLLRAKAAVETRKAEVIQAVNNVRDTEARISSILGIDIKQRFEYVPNFVPNLRFPSVDLGDAFVTALSNRPEILQCGQQVEIAAARANRSKHELLPVLDLLIGTYVSGLDRDYEFVDAFGRQFSDGAPGYSAALNFEMPLHRRAPKARLERDELRWQAITSDLESKILEVKSEVDIAVREVETSHRKLVARSIAMDSARQEMQAQRERLILSLNDGDHIGNTLNFLLDAQDRLATQENLLAQAQSDYMISWVALKKAMGTLVLVENGK